MCQCQKFTSMIGLWVCLGNVLHTQDSCEPIGEDHRLYVKDHL